MTGAQEKSSLAFLARVRPQPARIPRAREQQIIVDTQDESYACVAGLHFLLDIRRTPSDRQRAGAPLVAYWPPLIFGEPRFDKFII